MRLTKPYWNRRSAYKALVALLGGYVLLALLYSLSTPPFEAPDEYYHFAFIAHVARTGTLPPNDHPLEHAWRQMVYHAPLYYLVSAVIATPFDTSDFPSHYPLNPHASIGVALASDNVNFVAHVDDWHGAALAVRAVRLFSIVLGATTLVGVFALSLALFPKREYVALLAVLVVMLNPQFLYISGVISNDNAVTAFTTLSLALAVHMIRTGATVQRVAVLSLTAACASLSKASGMTFYVAVPFILFWLWRAYGLPLRRAVLYALMIAAVWIVIAGWWYGRNFLLYGDFSAAHMVAAATSLRREIPDLVGELRGLYFSFWGLFGWFNISAPLVFYQWTLMLLGLAFVGLMSCIRRCHPKREDFVVGVALGIHTVIFIAAWWGFNQVVQASQGRLLFPLLGVFAAIVGRGLSRIPKPLSLGLLVGVGAATASFPFTLLAPAYTPMPQILAASWQPPENAVAMHFREPWNDKECLILWAVPPEWSHQPDAPITIHFYWQSLCQMTGYWSVFVHFVDTARDLCTAGDNSHVLRQVDTMPEGGRLPLPAFHPGDVITDTITLNSPPELDLTREWHVQTGLYDAGGTFMRAFVYGDGDNNITIGRCAPESVVFRLP
jgi:4-amino-4-deoxy-L-arabinose transferase-like glycosyltransferase